MFPSCRASRLVAVLLACGGHAFAAERLPGLDADAAGVTVSGLSSGGYMAVQMHVAHSSVVKGSGAIASGPYYCAKGSLLTAYYNCMAPGFLAPLPPNAKLREEAEAQAKAGRIDATANLASSRAWLFTGTRDRTVSPEVVEALRAFYASYNAALAVVKNTPAGHAMVTEQAGNPDCGATEPPFINDCDYDAAGQMLSHLLGAAYAAGQPSGRVLRFDQREFAEGNAFAISMADEGYAYVPLPCETQRCRIHVAFHGCRQNAADVEDRFVREAGYNRWADAHKLIVLYPQTASRSGFSFAAWNYVWNPRGCWDWWGYTGTRYHTKNGQQIRAVWAMLRRLSGPRK